ncbi:redoxin family protein [Hymenobacter sp. RP-2-7]|uniref:Redoxin family protein n=1 Tax=Hymenobacter polaris TaxID=2682546 RepID=A0A7Y0FLJ7_9BACT|nr:redoxin family protein [Hymenobacter polaris]NML64560.1 redoxin family protein [Hymenobacter polaris]
MRNPMLGLAVMLLAHTAIAQSTTGAELSGRLDNALGDPLVISWRAQPLAIRQQQRTVHPDMDGNFRLRIPVQQPTLAQLTFGDEEMAVFLEPGDDLELRGDAIELTSTAKFAAAGGASQPAAAANNYLAEQGRRFTNNEAYQVLPENIKLLPTGFLSFLNYRREHEETLLKQASRRGHFTPAFESFARTDIAYTYAGDRLSYADLREQTVDGQARIELPADYYDFLQDVNLVPGQQSAATSTRYQDFLLDYVHYQARTTGHRPTDPDYFLTCYRLADKLLPTGPMRPVVLGRVVRETIEQGHVAHAQSLLATYAASNQVPASWVALLRSDFADHQSLAIGSPAPPLTLRATDGRKLTLADFKGKLVYITFWDSRFPAGQRLLPFAKELVQNLAGQPIVVVMAALDDAPTYWQQSVAGATPGLGGVQAYVPLAEQRAVRQAYNLNRLPSAVLIAEDGTLLDLHPRDLSSRPLQDDLRAAVGRAAAYKAVALSQL